MKRALIYGLILLRLGTVALDVNADALSTSMSDVAINGQQLSVLQLRMMESQIGARIPPGVYLLNAQGCWLNASTGASGCLGAVDTYSRNGSGERTSDGSWNHYSNSAEMGVGGTSDGCIYTTSGWSNC